MTPGRVIHRTIPGGLVAAGAMLRALAAAMRHRRALRQLHQLDDHLLRDLGITRADIPRAVRGEARRC